jgi:hypothetical protein
MAVSFTPGLFTQEVKAASTRWVGGLLGLKTVLDVVWEGRILILAWNRTPA